MSDGTRVLLLAVDDTADDVHACEWVIENLLRPGDRVHFVHVVPRFTYASQYGGLYDIPMAGLPVDEDVQDQATYEALLEHAEAFIRDKFVSLFKDLLSEPIIHLVKSEVDNDAIGKVICRKAGDLKPAAVVVAKHTKGKLADFFMGSVCKYCCMNCQQTVIVAHPICP